MFVVGDTVIAAVLAPVFQLYVPPAVAVNVVLVPVQIVVFPVIVGLGGEVIVTVTIVIPVHPLVVAVTVYVVGIAGDTVILVVDAPLSHTYVVPPFAVSVVLVPGHTLVVPVILGVGLLITVTCCDAVPLHVPLVTVTLYVVLTAGVIVIDAPVDPSLQA